MKIDPRKNPAVLDTATWDPASAWRAVSAVDEPHWDLVATAIREGHTLPTDERCVAYVGSSAEYQDGIFFLAGLADGQHVFVELGAEHKSSALGKPMGRRSLKGGIRLAVYPTDAATIDRYVSLIRPDKGPKALGAIPRLGIGSRMTTAAWPGVWQAMNKSNFCANPIQNSVREVNVLQDILAGRPPRLNYMANFGRVEEGHTGSTFEGLWTAGVLEALKVASSPRFGADADHITVRRGADDVIRSERVIEAARLYTFFTLDVSDLLDYEACLIDKYQSALDAVDKLAEHIATIKKGVPFDLELSIDETPSGIDAFSCLTSETELTFLILESQRRQIPVTHIAPNFGVEKERDYRGGDGLAGLEKRIRGLCDIAREFGIMLDCHSGDDLKPATRRAVGRASQGHIHFKVSPALQVIFGETMKAVEPERFRLWWDDTLSYARREAAAGSDFAAECIRQYETSDNPECSPNHAVFHYFNFASVGKRDRQGRFVHREMFYDLPAEFYCEYQRRICSYLCDVAADVFHRR